MRRISRWREPGRFSCAAARAQALDPLESWKRNHWGIEATATVQDCLACHEGRTLSVHASHPVDVDYATA